MFGNLKLDLIKKLLKGTLSSDALKDDFLLF